MSVIVVTQSSNTSTLVVTVNNLPSNSITAELPASKTINVAISNVYNTVRYVRVTGSDVTTTGQSLVDITGLLVALEVNSVYEFEVNLVCGSDNTSGMQYGINFSSSGATIESHIVGASSSSTAKDLRMNSFNTASGTYLVSSSQTGGILIKGIVTTTTNAGNFTVQHLKFTSGTSTVFINSFLKVSKIA